MNRRDFFLAGGALALPATSWAESAKGAMRITFLETDLLRFPPGKPFADAIHNFGTEAGGVALRLRTDAGITVWAYISFGMIAGGPRVVQTILEQEIKPVLIGKDPALPKRPRAELWKGAEYQGVEGLGQFAIAAVDIAIWDLLGTAAGLPVYKMLGAYADRVPAYSMCGWYFEGDGDLSQFKRAIAAAFEEGFPAAKIKVGRAPLEDDIRPSKRRWRWPGRSAASWWTRIRPST